jgi:hypothetical protein
MEFTLLSSHGHLRRCVARRLDGEALTGYVRGHGTS